MKRSPTLLLLSFACIWFANGPSVAGDWAQFRYDNGRTAATPTPLPADLHLQWMRSLPPPRPAFPGEVRIRYDATYEPVVADKTMFVPSMVTDSVTALDTETGKRRWQFFTEGPVRFAPAVWGGKVYFVSDDGYLYCVAATDGKVLWRFRGLPADRHDRKVIGDGRLVSLFPARGGPVIADGVVYFAAGIWSGEGVFVHALHAESGQVIWSNVDSDRIARANMDHGVSYYAGISPQGYLAIVDDKLIVPCGPQLPAVLDLKTGQLNAYTMGWGGRVGLAKGAWFVAGVRNYLVHGGDLYDIRRSNDEQFRQGRGRGDAKKMFYLAGLTRLQIDRTNQKGLGQFRRPVLTESAIYYSDKGIVAHDLTQVTVEERSRVEIPPHRRADQYPDKLRGVFPQLWRLDSGTQAHIKAGNRLFCGRQNVVEAVDVPEPGDEPRIGWRTEIEGTPHSMLAADERLFVVTREGRIYAFGQKRPVEPVVYRPTSADPTGADEWTARTGTILETTDATTGYALVLGIGTGQLAEQLARQSALSVIAIEADAQKAARLRQRFATAGLYGSRVTILVGDPTSYPLPPYFASLIVTEDSAVVGEKGRAFVTRLLHYLRPYGGTVCLAASGSERRALAAAIADAELAGISVRQVGDLTLACRAGSLPQSADWSHGGGDAANMGTSQDQSVSAPLSRLWFDGSFRWNRTIGSSIVRVVGGRIIVHTGDLHAIDVYTGRQLWRNDAATPRPTDDRMVAVEDAIYVAVDKTCVVFDPATGDRRTQIKTPDEIAHAWSIIRVDGDQLIGACSQWLVCFNRHDGSVLWQQERPARIGCLAVGGGKVYAADFVQTQRDQKPPPASIGAFDQQTGKPLWQATGGAVIRYCESADLLCTSQGVFQGHDGARIRDDSVFVVAGDKLVSGDHQQVLISDAKSGERLGKELKWNRRGCTILRGSSKLLTTRFMGNAAYLDIATGQITSIWNVRAACSNNLFPANGVLNLPNLTGGCTCNYMPISQALVPAAVVQQLAVPPRDQR